MELPGYELIIDGRQCPAQLGQTYPTINPFTGEAWARVPDATAEDVDLAVQAARGALAGPWGALTGFERAALLRRLGDIVVRDAEELANLETRDNGKLLRETRGQMAAVVSWLRYFSGVADKLHGETIPMDKPNFFVYTREEPIGVIAAIVPWNSPLLLTVWKLAPALAAGCTMVIKPSDATPVTLLEFAKRVHEAGFPDGVVNTITGRSPELGRLLVEHPGIDKIAFTGSPKVGAAIASGAGARLKPVLLELGGKSAQIVFDDADLDATANGVIAGIFAAGGQTCVAGSRLIVHRDVREALLERVVARARTIRLGDPTLPETEMGPLATERQLETVLGFIERAIADGATVLSGGRVSPERGGLFMEPTIVTGVSDRSELAQEEVFGPVLAVFDFDTEDEAIATTNDTVYGLGAGQWTSNLGRAHRVAHRLQAGTVWVDSYRLVAPNVPFGGLGASGYGRENGRDAVKEFLRTKAIWVELEGQTRDPFTLG